ncbi:DUF58 domain-containing protein [Pseudoxanthomonas daejeonensis]|uniref:DUF58 domain-containing protein n=1 Tax=Pseudoxanthomonas daejeonensis TaxID=266062 RepID=UPI001F5411AD|nr:DUF58 domain-containing protein [Pseudoxanthomonas daejeonensis]UNK58093.1 DUF58 domain-containing protein [Pseudoxanthomonas daejeonensis]
MSTAGPVPAVVDAAGQGIVPTVAELVALRAEAQRTPQPRRGRHGVHGSAPSALRGRGMEYAESREYVAGDDVRRMDWRLTARSGRAHTKLFQAERERLTLLVADTAPALYFGTRVRFKSVQAARAGAVAVWTALQAGDRIAALRGGEPAIPPATGLRGAMRVLDALARWYARPPQDDAGLEVALEHAQRLLRPGAQLLVLADAASASRVPALRWTALARHHQATLVLLQDPLETSPPRGEFAFRAGLRRLQVALDRAAVRGRWHQAFVEPAQELSRTLPGLGWQVRCLSSDAASGDWLRPRDAGMAGSGQEATPLSADG